MTPLVLLVMGASGTGKTTVARALAGRLDLPFQEGDDLHAPEAVAKMRGGTPLSDADRAPWLDRVAGVMAGWAASGTGGVITCSALRRRYRDRLRAGAAFHIVFLHADPATLAARLAQRRGHYMPAGLLASQLQTLEPPDGTEGAIHIAVDGTPDDVVDAAERAVSPFVSRRGQTAGDRDR